MEWEAIVGAAALCFTIIGSALMMGRRLGRIETSLEHMDGHLREMSDTVRADHDRLESHEVRISLLEQRGAATA